MKFLTKYYESLEKIVDRETYELSNGINSGITTGFKEIDNTIGKFKKGHLWVIGGLSGTGKSFFVLNMIDNILKADISKKIVMFSTEIGAAEYSMRHILLRMETYRMSIEQNPSMYKQKLNDTSSQYLQERLLDPNSYIIHGNVKTFEDIEKKISLTDVPDLIFIDFIQDLSVGGRFLLKDTMPELTAKISRMARNLKCTVIVVSQLNNSSLGNNYSSERSIPYSWGKELNQSADVSLVLTRQKKNDRLIPLLEMSTIKSRHGDYSYIPFRIKNGFRLETLTKDEANSLIKRYDNE